MQSPLQVLHRAIAQARLNPSDMLMNLCNSLIAFESGRHILT
jgi:hypothetical protein